MDQLQEWGPRAMRPYGPDGPWGGQPGKATGLGRSTTWAGGGRSARPYCRHEHGRVIGSSTGSTRMFCPVRVLDHLPPPTYMVTCEGLPPGAPVS